LIISMCDFEVRRVSWSRTLEGRRSAHRAIRSGDLLFVSGQVGSREDGFPERDFEAQVRLAFQNLAAVLKAPGCTLHDVVDVTTFHTRPEAQLETVMAVRQEGIGDPPYPNWTAVGVTWLAGFDFEIKVIARVPKPDLLAG
jgi:enamine deaminase RidA (YjgF/YER057c/UK114 family)